MLQRLVLLLCSAVLIWPAWTAATAKKPASSKKTASSQKKKAAPAKKKTAASRSKSRSRRTPATTWRNRQRQPTPERYAEIERALAGKGYLQAEADGKWDESSVQALQRFQRDQHLEPSGKLDSLTIIALGLGPKHEPLPGASSQK